MTCKLHQHARVCGQIYILQFKVNNSFAVVVLISFVILVSFAVPLAQFLAQ